MQFVFTNNVLWRLDTPVLFLVTSLKYQLTADCQWGNNRLSYVSFFLSAHYMPLAFSFLAYMEALCPGLHIVPTLT